VGDAIVIVTIVSCFRNATTYIPRYFDQVNALAVALAKRGDKLTLVLGYGDSTDDTELVLNEEAMFSMGAILIDVSHGGKHYGSVVNAQRFKQLAYVGNKLWAAIPADADVAILVESDLIWDTSTLIRLIDDLEQVPAVAPMIMHLLPPNRFYDRWAFVKDSINFTNEPPYHVDLLTHRDRLLKLDSAGSVLAMHGDLARGLHWPEQDVVVGLCRGIYAAGGSVWLDRELTVYHP
jgi:hypothetical protein